MNTLYARIRGRLKDLSAQLQGQVRWLPIGLAAFALTALCAVYLFRSGGEERPLVLSTGLPGGTYSALGETFAQMLGSGEDPIEIQVISSEGSNQNAARISRGAADLGFIQSNTAVTEDVEIIARLYPEVFHLIVREDSGIEKITDMKGRRVALPPEGSGSVELFRKLLRHYEVPMSSIQAKHGSLKEGMAALRKGEADALFIVVALGNKAIETLIKTTDTRLLGIDQANAMALFDPALAPITLPVGIYSGSRPAPDRAIQVLAIDALLVANRKLPAATVNHVTRALFERRQEMLDKSRQAAFITAPTDRQRFAIGVHPGAEQYYSKDSPSFLVEYAEPIGVGFSAIALLVSALWQARIWLSNARKNRADHYNLEIAHLVQRIEAAETPAMLSEIQGELTAIFQKVIVDLDTDKIDESSLQPFAFAWQVAQSLLSQRATLLSQHAPSGSAKRKPRRTAPPAKH